MGCQSPPPSHSSSLTSAGRLVEILCCVTMGLLLLSKTEGPRNLLKRGCPARCHRPASVPVRLGFFNSNQWMCASLVHSGELERRKRSQYVVKATRV